MADPIQSVPVHSEVSPPSFMVIFAVAFDWCYRQSLERLPSCAMASQLTLCRQIANLQSFPHIGQIHCIFGVHQPTLVGHHDSLTAMVSLDAAYKEISKTCYQSTNTDYAGKFKVVKVTCAVCPLVPLPYSVINFNFKLINLSCKSAKAIDQA